MKDKDLKFSLKSIKQLSSYLNSMETLSITDFDNSKVGYGKGFKIDFDNNTGLFKLDVKIDFLYNISIEKAEPYKLFGILVVHEFEFEDYKETVKLRKNGEIDIPTVLLVNLVSIAYSTARGLLFGISQKTDYDELILPLTDPKEFSSYFNAKDED